MMKFDFLENNTSTDKILKAFNYLPDDNSGTVKKNVDESEIKNTLKDAWKELENLDSKINSFKAGLFAPKGTKPNASNLLTSSKPLEKEGECK